MGKVENYMWLTFPALDINSSALHDSFYLFVQIQPLYSRLPFINGKTAWEGNTGINKLREDKGFCSEEELYEHEG